MTNPTTFENFAALDVQVQETRIFLRRFGAGPAVLLLHGFPQTHLMWRSVAPLLARRFTVICAELRGYGRSQCPASAPDHAQDGVSGALAVNASVQCGPDPANGFCAAGRSCR